MAMKALTVFLSLYILLLSGMPCDDIVIWHSSEQTSLSQNTADAGHGDADHCSPFCTCQCCQACFQISDPPSFIALFGFGITYNEIKPDFESVILFDFQVPPKA